MEWLLCLGHAALGLALLVAEAGGPRARRRAVEGASFLGVLLGTGLVVAGEAGADPWRSVVFESRATVPAGSVVAAAWLVTGALAARVRPAEAALTGVASSGLVLALAGRYVVPALLFWLCGSLALAAGARSRVRWAVLAASDAALCVALILHVATEDTWSLGPLEGASSAALVVAAATRAGACLVWGRGREAHTVLVAGGGVALAAAQPGLTEAPAALALVAGALAVLVRGLLEDMRGPRVVATWAAALALGVALASPAQAPAAGAAAAVTVGAAVLWPYTAGRGGVARALLVSAVPLTAGFAVAAGGAADAFGRDEGAWTIVALLLPIALAGAAVLGGRVARTDATEFVPEAILATWILLGASIAIGIGAFADSGGALALQLVALALGAVAAIVVRRNGLQVEAARAQAVPVEHAHDVVLPRSAQWATLAVAGAVGVTAVWLTISGLRVGFL